MSKLIKTVFIISVLVLGVSCQKEGTSKNEPSHDENTQSRRFITLVLCTLKLKRIGPVSVLFVI